MRIILGADILVPGIVRVGPNTVDSDKLISRKLSHMDTRCDNTCVVVCVTECSKRDLIKRFDDIKID